jgi:hypothetical protein
MARGPQHHPVDEREGQLLGQRGHLKDEFYTGRTFASYSHFKRELTEYITYWNTQRRQKQIKGHTPEEYRNMSLNH